MIYNNVYHVRYFAIFIQLQYDFCFHAICVHASTRWNIDVKNNGRQLQFERFRFEHSRASWSFDRVTSLSFQHTTHNGQQNKYHTHQFNWAKFRSYRLQGPNKRIFCEC